VLTLWCPIQAIGSIWDKCAQCSSHIFFLRRFSYLTEDAQKHLPRINTEFHGRKNKQKHLPRINTEFHGNKTNLSKPDASATVATLRRRIQLIIAYLYKPEAQAKVFKRSKAFLPRRPRRGKKLGVAEPDS
jgi:hypothetical protein